VTERERIDRETLLKRAVAAAGAVYLAPALTSAAAAGSDGCLDFSCSKKKKKYKKHRKKCQSSGASCDCPVPGHPCVFVGEPAGP
jgi:hypothetical protein